jgi:hypothetical protein
MSEFAKTTGKLASSIPSQHQFKYPSEDETYVRRIGSGVLSVWPSLSPEQQQMILREASQVWDREYGQSGLSQKLESFVRRHPQRMG